MSESSALLWSKEADIYVCSDETPSERAGLMSLPVMESNSQRAKDLEKNQLSEEIARVAKEKVEAEVRTLLSSSEPVLIPTYADQASC